ncbi:hypothetical protein JL720_5269 [Aureococcus anophagefferens]|nr:hypothetical protein JL720_5269 [Aureococcus anophagefferens]
MAPKGRDEAEPQARKSRLGQKRAYIPENPGDGEFPRAASTDSLFGGGGDDDPPTPRITLQPLGKASAARGAPEKKKPGKKGKKQVPSLSLGQPKLRASSKLTSLEKTRLQFERELALDKQGSSTSSQPQGFGYGSRASSAPPPRGGSVASAASASSQSTRLTAHLPWNKDGPKNYKKPWDGAGKHSTNARNRDERTRAASVVREWWIAQRANLDHYHLRVLFYKHEKEASARMGDFKRHQLHLIQTQQRCFTEDAQAFKDEVAAQQAEWSEAMERREQAAMEQEVMLSARGLEAEEQRERMKREIEAEKERNLEAARAAAEKRKEEDRLRREEDKAKKEEEELALTRHLAQAKAEAELLAQIDPIRRFLDKECEASDVWTDQDGRRLPQDYVLGPRALEDGEDAPVGDEALAVRRTKMGEDWVLLMRSQTFLRRRRSSMRVMAKSWKNAMPSHWFEIIRGLYDAGTIAINLNADGNATECWF